MAFGLVPGPVKGSFLEQGGYEQAKEWGSTVGQAQQALLVLVC
ncbi:hypothetical protein [Pontibacter actiniarum]|nr:hypothetical protein [Pontibacter actiniarum]